MTTVCSINGCDKPKSVRGWCWAHYYRWKRYGEPNPPSFKPQAPHGAPAAWLKDAVNSSTDECLLWPFGVCGTGYGSVKWEGARSYPHRVVLILSSGFPEGRQEAAHAPGVCHNRLCCNPRHLRWATPAENNADKVIDGTHHRGERHGNAKLTEVEVLAIRADDRTQRAIAADYGVSEGTVNHIKRRATWGWLVERQDD